MSKMIEIIVDNKTYSVEEGSLLIDLLIKEEIKVPYFCYHESLGTDGNCRMCMVEIAGQKRPQIACDTFIKAGMEVNSKSENINKVRTNILELELINHPVDCPTCDQAGECSLQDFYMDYGLHDAKVNIAEKVKHEKHVDLGSNVMLDQERCVLCARCTRFTDKITHTHELGIVGRGDEAKVSTMPGRKLDNSYAMNVVDLCPVGALTSKDFRFHQRVWFLKSADSVCQGCAKGCNIYIDHNRPKYQDDVIYRFRPRRNDEVNGFFICDEGRMSYKELETNRQENILFEGEVVDEMEAIERYKALFSQYRGEVTVVIDANLYSEEIEAIVTYSKSIEAKVYVPLACYDDPSFADEMLKSAKRAANYATVIEMGLETIMPTDIGLLINFNHSTPIKAKAEIFFSTHQGDRKNLIFPIAAFSENSGSLTNEDGIVQWCEKAVEKNSQAPTIIRWIEKVQE